MATTVNFNGASTSGGGTITQIGLQNVDTLIMSTTDLDKRTLLLNEFGPVDPEEERVRIVVQKGGLLEGLCSWVLKEPAFQQWWAGENENILWIHGDAGKGKTMIMEAVVQELDRRCFEHDTELAFFFCQRTDDRLNSATSILRGLLYSLTKKNQTCAKFLGEKYHIRPLESEPVVLFWRLWKVFVDLIEKTQLSKLYFCIDALDECSSGLSDLLYCIESLKVNSKCYWVLSSRNESDIYEQLDKSKITVQTSLELNDTRIANAVKQFIDVKINDLTERKDYNSTIKSEVREYLLQNAENTFLWVALVCQELDKVKDHQAVQTVSAFPPGLTPLYKAMLVKVQKQANKVEVEMCQKLISVMACVFRPQLLQDIALLCKLPDQYMKDGEIEKLLRQCGSFFTTRNGRVYFVHQSVTDFFVREDGRGTFLEPIKSGHRSLAGSLLGVLDENLRRDALQLRKPGALIQDIERASIDKGISPLLQYASLFWIQHFFEAEHKAAGLRDGGPIDLFLRKHFLEWVEILAWLRAVSLAAVGMDALRFESELGESCDQVNQFIDDCSRVIATFRVIIDVAPLQVYFTALIHSPQKSLVKQAFSHRWPKWIRSGPQAKSEWGSNRILLGELSTRGLDRLQAVFSPDSRVLAASSWQEGVWVVLAWDTTTGEVKGRLYLSQGIVSEIKFSEDSKTIIVASEDGMVRIWKVADGTTRGDIRASPTESFGSASLSANGQRAAFATSEGIVSIMDVMSGDILSKFPDNQQLDNVILSPDGSLVGCANGRDSQAPHSIRIRDTADGRLRMEMSDVIEILSIVTPPGKVPIVFVETGGDGGVLPGLGGSTSMILQVELTEEQKAKRVTYIPRYYPGDRPAISPDGKLIVAIDTLIDVSNPIARTKKLNPAKWNCGGSFSADSQSLAIANSNELQIWNTTTRTLRFRFPNPVPSNDLEWRVAISPDGKKLVRIESGPLYLFDANSQKNFVKSGEKGDVLSDLKRAVREYKDILKEAVFSGRIVALEPCQNDELLLCLSTEGELTFWNMKEPEKPVVVKKRRLTSEGIRSHSGQARRMWASSSGRYVLILWYRPDSIDPTRPAGRLKVHDLQKKETIASSGPEQLPQNFGPQFQYDVVFSVDESRVTISWGPPLAGELVCDLKPESPSRGFYTSSEEYRSQDSPSKPESRNPAPAVEAIQRQSPWALQDNKWVTWKGERFLWLPEEHRAMTSLDRKKPLHVFIGNTLVIVEKSNSLMFLTLDNQVITKEGWFTTRTRDPKEAIPRDGRGAWERRRFGTRSFVEASWHGFTDVLSEEWPSEANPFASTSAKTADKKQTSTK